MSENSIICVGSALWDVIARAEHDMSPGHDSPGRITRRPGGVALNVAIALLAEGARPIVLSAIGNDDEGRRLIEDLTGRGIDCGFVTRVDDPTDSYIALENKDGEVFGAIADCYSLELAGSDIVTPLKDGRLASPQAPFKGTIVIDGNPPERVLNDLVAQGDLDQARLYFAPASPGKAERLRAVFEQRKGTLFVNKREAEILIGKEFGGSREAAIAVAELVGGAVVTNSAEDATMVRDGTVLSVTPPDVTVRSVTGAGDAFLAGFLAAEIKGEHPATCLLEAADAAARHISRGAE